MLPFLFTRPDKTIHDLDWTKGGGGGCSGNRKNDSSETSRTRV